MQTAAGNVSPSLASVSARARALEADFRAALEAAGGSVEQAAAVLAGSGGTLNIVAQSPHLAEVELYLFYPGQEAAMMPREILEKVKVFKITGCSGLSDVACLPEFAPREVRLDMDTEDEADVVWGTVRQMTSVELLEIVDEVPTSELALGLPRNLKLDHDQTDVKEHLRVTNELAKADLNGIRLEYGDHYVGVCDIGHVTLDPDQ
ncbi:hypothetical protein DFJ74DRAFT_709519 [Hyaloraphidium curvatum]|nr:hypothetical protein DFJ74DRAFT_709519 [Hyaloraphidium curvatum]